MKALIWRGFISTCLISLCALTFADPEINESDIRDIDATLNDFQLKLNKLDRIEDMLLERNDNLRVLEYKASSYKKNQIYSDKLMKQLRKEVDNNIATVSAVVTEIKQESFALQASVAILVAQLQNKSDELDKAWDEIDKTKFALAEIEATSTSNLAVVNVRLSNGSIYYWVLFFGIIVTIIWAYRVWRQTTRSLAMSISESRLHIDAECNGLDLKLSELLESQLSIAAAVPKQTSSDPADHTLAIKVATEIHRMSKRIGRMPPDTKGLKPLAKALERLVENLGDEKYQIVELLGREYVDGMVVNQEIIIDETLAADEKIITNVVKPQINHNDIIVQVADVVVSIGE